jgi:prepilin-type N-terminal cleavage/methylation domain-containing protein
MKRNKGFTLIELLVVIAIIGILTAIVMSSLTQARDKAKDAKIQSQLVGMRAASEIYYTGHGNKYNDLAMAEAKNGIDCSDVTASPILFNDIDSGMQRLASSTPDITCFATPDQWIAVAPLVSNTDLYWCVDNTGVSRQISSTSLVPSVSVAIVGDPSCPAN